MPDNKITFTIDLAEQVAPDGSSIIDLIINRCAHQMLSRYAIDPDGAEVHVGGSALSERIAEIVGDRVEATVRELTPDVVEHVVNQGIPRGRKYDHDLGESVEQYETITEFFERYVKQQLVLRDRSDRLSRNRERTVLENVLETTIDRELTKELRDAVDEAKRVTLDAVRDQAAQVITETIARATQRI